jgi:hypothetical protein
LVSKNVSKKTGKFSILPRVFNHLIVFQFKLLKQTLEDIESQLLSTYQQRLLDLRTRLKRNRNDFELRIHMFQLERDMETRICAAFLHFMCTCFYGYKQFLRPILRRPNELSTDASVLFEFDSFLRSRDSSYSKFYSYILHTQMFTRFIEERSFLSSSTLNQSSLINENLHNYSLAFFDDCCSKVKASIENNEQQTLNLLDVHDTTMNYLSEKTTLILPELTNLNHSGAINGCNDSTDKSDKIINNGNQIHSQRKNGKTNFKLPQEQSQISSVKHIPNSPMIKRSKFERDKCQKVIFNLKKNYSIFIFNKKRSHEKIKQNQHNGLIVYYQMFILYGLCIYQQ